MLGTAGRNSGLVVASGGEQAAFIEEQRDVMRGDEAIGDFKSGKSTRPAFLRALASASRPHALCEVTPQGAQPLVVDGQLHVLTDASKGAAFEAAEPALVASRKLTLQPIDDGVGVFANMPGHVKSLRFDAGSPTEFTFAPTELVALRHTARAIAVERAVANVGTVGAETFRTVVRNHERFFVPLAPVTHVGGRTVFLQGSIRDGKLEAHEILHHRRPDGTEYAVVFTAEDCLEAFFTQLGTRTPFLVVDGAALFAEIKRQEEAFGLTSIVFNMEGPPPQAWIKAGAWRFIL